MCQIERPWCSRFQEIWTGNDKCLDLSVDVAMLVPKSGGESKCYLATAMYLISKAATVLNLSMH